MGRAPTHEPDPWPSSLFPRAEPARPGLDPIGPAEPIWAQLPAAARRTRHATLGSHVPIKPRSPQPRPPVVPLPHPRPPPRRTTTARVGVELSAAGACPPICRLLQPPVQADATKSFRTSSCMCAATRCPQTAAGGPPSLDDRVGRHHRRSPLIPAAAVHLDRR